MSDRGPDPLDQTVAVLLDEVARLRAEVTALRGRAQPTPAPPPDGPVSRRAALRLAGTATVAAVAAVAGSGAGARPAAAADPNDVVKNVNNTVSTTTTLTGSVNGAVLQLTNTGSSGRGLLAQSAAVDAGAVRGNNTNASGIGGVGVAGYAPGGRDLQAFGSGRIAMNSHAFSIAENTYTVGEVHQQGGTLYLMVNPTTRRVLAGPATAGALHPVNPSRVYDSRLPTPTPGKLAGGGARVVSVADARSTTTGLVTLANLVPSGATAVAFNLTVTGTTGAGFLSIAAGDAATYSASLINWTNAGTTTANASVVPLDANRQVKVFCGGGSAHFILDIVGYYR
jgi:hypothetical protein